MDPSIDSRLKIVYSTENPHRADLEYDLAALIDASFEGKGSAYIPASDFAVGAALVTAEGNIVTGCNVESCSYGLTMCAERTAIFKAVSKGHRKFKAIAIASNSSEFIRPCGACRQVLIQHGDYDVLLTKPDKTYVFFTVLELLPIPFLPSDLDPSIERIISTSDSRLNIVYSTENPHRADLEYDLAALIDTSISEKDFAYIPVSKYAVGAAVVADGGQIFGGCNVECCSFSLTACAERTAIFNAVSDSKKHRRFKAIAIAGNSSEFVSPCGDCRQVLAEFGDYDVLLTKPDKTYAFFTVHELLPIPFLPSDLDPSLCVAGVDEAAN